jgi:hypothetical protein
MKHICSYQTAKLLKEAGFPAPEPAFGQFWYSNIGYCFVCPKAIIQILIPETYITGITNTSDSLSRSSHPDEIIKNCTYTPSVIDILEHELMEGYWITYDGKEWSCGDTWTPWCDNENPAEAAALQFLRIVNSKA